MNTINKNKKINHIDDYNICIDPIRDFNIYKNVKGTPVKKSIIKSNNTTILFYNHIDQYDSCIDPVRTN